MIQQSKKAQRNIAFESWYRCKEHYANLQTVLIREAKQDLLEKLIQKQEEKDYENEQRYQKMYEWGERKLVQEALEREHQLRLKEKERLTKQMQKEKSYQVFKEWLKVSLIKLREEGIHKKIRKHEKRLFEEEK